MADAPRGIERNPRTRVQRAGDRARRSGTGRGWPRSGADFCDLAPEDQDERLRRSRSRAFTAMVYEHCCEGMYGAPEYGGNRDGVGWLSIDFPGDVQPRGYSDAEVAGP